MKYLLFFFALILFSCQNSTEKSSEEVVKTFDSTNVIVKDSTFLMKFPIITWLRKNPAEIGCMLEKEIGYRDSVFNCDYKNYNNDGDPCENTKEYYEGIEFPENLSSKVHSSIKSIRLDFEHGNLRELSITFKDSILKDDVKKLFNLPDKTKLPDNIMAITYGENVSSMSKPKSEKYTCWLNIYGFEHMGRGDVDCE